MLAELAISVSIGTLAFSAWYFICVHANRRKALLILRWMEAALAGRGHVTGIRWLSSCRFQIDLRLPRSNFRRASFLAQLTPRELPLEWLLYRRAGRRETLTFSADLDYAPAVNLEVLNQRWEGCTAKPAKLRGTAWRFHPTGPFVMTTSQDWKREISSMVTSLLATREQDVLSVRFQRRSPHFSATLPLSSLPARAECDSSLMDSLRELATEASASPS
jgi:hypothetical protein